MKPVESVLSPGFARIEIPTAGHGDSAKATIYQDLFITKRLHEHGANSIYIGKLWGELGYKGVNFNGANSLRGETTVIHMDLPRN